MDIYNLLGRLKVKINKGYYKHKYGDYAIRNIQGYNMILDLNDAGISLDLMNKGVREEDIYFRYKDLIEKGDVILDIGSNIGYYALMSAKKVGKTGLIYGVEPVIANYELFKANICLNQISNIKHYNYAFGDKEEESRIDIYPEESNRHTLRQNAFPSKRFQVVKMITADSFIKDKKKPNIVRMDVEGYEYEIIQGMKDLLYTKELRLIYLELHCMYLKYEQTKELLTTLWDAGFTIEYCVFEKGEGWTTPKYLKRGFKKFESIFRSCCNLDYCMSLEVKDSKFGYGILFKKVKT